MAWLIVAGLGLFLLVEGLVSRPDEAASPTTARYTDVADAAGLRFRYQPSHTSRKYLIETMGAGAALADFDNDGRLDVFLVNGAQLLDPTPIGATPQKSGSSEWNRLYRQKPDGSFEDVTERAGLQGVGYGMGAAVGDYDNDGAEDLYVTGYGGNRLYRNVGDGRFTDVTGAAGVAGGGWSSSAAWVDLDADGFLDLVVLRYLRWDFRDVWCGERREGLRAYCHPDVFEPIAPLVYRNDGKGHFIEVSSTLALSKPGKSLGIAIADYDRDGRIDVFVANDSMPEFLYHNRGDGRFEEVGLASQVAVDGEGRTYAGMGVDFADYDNDGLPDLVVDALASQMYALYKNNGDGGFAYVSHGSGLGRMTLAHSGWGARFLDYDNDGRKDLLVAQSHVLDTIELTSPNVRYREPMLLAWNAGATFVEVVAADPSPLRAPWLGRGLAIGDIDNDGRIDAIVTTNDGPVHLLRNETATANHWLLLKLIGHTSNRDAIGAEVRVVTGAGAQMVTVSTASSYLSSSDKRVHFGLGSATAAATIEIRWPSGVVQRLTDIAADQILQIDEPPRATGER
jgi:hypothetical protein